MRPLIPFCGIPLILYIFQLGIYHFFLALLHLYLRKAETKALSLRFVRSSRILHMRRFLVPKPTTADGTDSEPPAKKVKSETAVEVSCSVTAESHSDDPRRYLDNLLSPEEQANAASLPGNTWIDLPAVLLKLRSDANRVYSGILALDMDSTVIKTRSGKTFATNKEDWQFWSDKVVPTLKHYHDELNFSIALISNQGGVAKGRQNVQELQEKVDKVIDATELPIDFICCLSSSPSLYRKPLPGMWYLLDAARWQRWRHGKQADGQEAVRGIYVGDAAGRLAPQHKVKDFSDSDLKFARNLDLQFFAPEVFFHNATLPVHRDVDGNLKDAVRLANYAGGVSHDPALFLPPRERQAYYLSMSPPPSADAIIPPCTLPSAAPAEASSSTHAVASLPSHEVVLLVGPPGSGKSTFSARFPASSYTRINQDTLVTLAKCLKAAGEALAAGKSVLVDNTNGGPAVRAEWVKLAQKAGVPVRCVVLAPPKALSFSLLALRQVDPLSADPSRHVPEMVVHKWWTDWVRPQAGGDIVHVASVDFVCSEEVVGDGKQAEEWKRKLSQALRNMYIK